MPKEVREPIQTYLTREERRELDRVAAAMGVSRSEALRRGVRALARRGLPTALRGLAGAGLVSPAAAGPGEPPPSQPVVPLEEILCELGEDREER